MLGKKQPHTPRSRVKSALRQLSLRSRERAAAIKRDGNTCCTCGKKGSNKKGGIVKTTVHHKNGVKWDKIIQFIYEELLVDPDLLEVLCVECHKKGHDIEKEEPPSK